MRESIKERIVSACDAALVAAGPHGDYAHRLGMPPERIFFGYDAVDNAYYAAGAERARANAETVRKAWKLPSRYILASARFIEKKNLARLIEAFAYASAGSGTGHHLVILGDGPERAVVEAAIKRHGVEDRVQLPGFRPYEALPDYYGLADGFAHVSLSEQWGLVINEAAASSLPLIVSRPCGAASALVREGENGFLLEPRDVPAMTRALRAVMMLSDEQRAQMGAQSRLIVGDWGPERYAGGLRSACEAAVLRPARSLPFADRMLFRTLAHLQINTVN
jgi:glycosyltransferase involved in cell wall biosynthesis